MVQRHLGTYQERLFTNITHTAEERYKLFLEKYPDLSQRVPQHFIASYLGISAEFLSRIRNKKLKYK
jgi:CRP-like cAMP-binding protein